MSTKTPCPYRAALSDSSWVYCRKEAGHADEHKPYESENDPYRCELEWKDSTGQQIIKPIFVKPAQESSGDWAIDCAKEIFEKTDFAPLGTERDRASEVIRKHVAKFIHGYTMIGPSPIGPMHGAGWNDVIGRILKDLEKVEMNKLAEQQADMRERWRDGQPRKRSEGRSRKVTRFCCGQTMHRAPEYSRCDKCNRFIWELK
jgi:hypothetical protein